MPNFSARPISHDEREFIDELRALHGWTNDAEALTYLIELARGKDISTPLDVTAPPELPPSGDGYFTAKLDARDEAPLQRIKDDIFENHGTDQDIHVLRALMRERLAVMDEKEFRIALPPKLQREMMQAFEKGQQTGKYKSPSQLLAKMVKDANAIYTY
jgi:hypothetical protein